MIVTDERDLDDDIPGIQNLWVQGVGCGTAIVNTYPSGSSPSAAATNGLERTVPYRRGCPPPAILTILQPPTQLEILKATR